MATTEVSEPSETLVNDARKGNRAALMRLATWHRERDLPADNETWPDSDREVALQIEAYMFDLEVRRVQAKQLRRVLELLSPEQPAFGSTRHARRDDMRRHASALGLPVQVFGADYYRGETATREPGGERQLIWGESITDEQARNYVIVCPTDGEREEETRAAVLTLFHSAFSRVLPFEVRHWNEPITEAGEEALFVLGLRS